MKILYILLICLLSGCATQMDLQTINMLNQRLNAIETGKIAPRNAPEASPRALDNPTNQVIEQPPYNPYPNRLNDAQRDFVNFMLNYLADEE